MLEMIFALKYQLISHYCLTDTNIQNRQVCPQFWPLA